MEMRRFPSWGPHPWIPACAGMTVMQRVSLAGMTVVQRSAFAGDTMALRRPNKGMKMGAAAPGVWSRVQGRGWVPAFAGTTGGAWHVFSHSNDGCARVSLAGMTVVQRSPCAGMTVVQRAACAGMTVMQRSPSCGNDGCVKVSAGGQAMSASSIWTPTRWLLRGSSPRLV